MASLKRILELVRKEFLQIFRDRRMLGMIMISPMVQLLVFGYAATYDVRHVPLAVVDEDHSRQSRDLVERFYASGYFDNAGDFGDMPPAGAAMDRGRVKVILHIPPEYSRRLARRQPAPLQLVYDGSDSNTANIARGYAEAILAGASQVIVSHNLARLGQSAAPLGGLRVEPRVWYNQDLKSINYMVPGMIAQILFMMTTMFTAMSIVKERELGTIEQLLVTPLRPLELMAGKIIPWILLGYAEAAFILFFGSVWFHVTIHGSLLLLALLSGLFILSTLALGLFISTISRTQQQAMVTNMFFMFPNFILAGFLFPIDNMPPFFQGLSYLLPMRYYLIMVRGIFLKGSTLADLLPDTIALLVMGVLLFLVSAARFHRRLE